LAEVAAGARGQRGGVAADLGARLAGGDQEIGQRVQGAGRGRAPREQAADSICCS